MNSFSKKFVNKSPFKQRNQSTILSDIEHKSEEFLNFPQEKARERTDNELGLKPDEDGVIQPQNDFPDGDARRHYNAGDETSRAIQDKLKYFGPVTKRVAGIVGSNVGGLIHEVQNIKEGRPIRESVEDATNNLAGSLSSLFTRKTSKKLFDKFYKKIAPDGKVKDSPIKQKDRKKEYEELSERFDGFNKDKDTLIIGRSNSPRGATFQNNLSKNMGVQSGKMKNRVKNSVMLKFDDDGFKYITQHSKR